MVRYICMLGVCCSGFPAYTQTDTGSLPPLRAVTAGVQYGSIFAHSPAVQNTKGSNPMGIEIQLMKQRVDRQAYNLCRCYPKQSLLAGVYSFDNEVLGWSAMAAYLLEPSYRIGNRVLISMRGAAGLAYASDPYRAEKNPTNMSYSTTINAYLMYGVGFQWLFSNRTALQITGNFQHISNGGMKQPNKGVNWPSVGLHLVHYNRTPDLYRGPRLKDTLWRNLGWRKDVAVFGIGKRWVDEAGDSKRLPVAGLMAQAGKQISVTNQLNAGVEWSYDGTIERRLEVHNLPGSPFKVAITGGHEFLLGRFIFSQHVGVYVYKDNPYNDAWFHRWGLLYHAGKHYWLGFNLKAHRQVADYIDIRLMYSWR